MAEVEEMKKTSNAQLQGHENFDVRCWMFRAAQDQLYTHGKLADSKNTNVYIKSET